MTAPQLTLQSITGVDVEMQIAGPGARSYAFVIDWHIRIVLMLAWFFLSSFAFFGRFAFDDAIEASSRATYQFVVVLPATLIYLLYHPVLEIAMRGRTPGKRLAGVRIVTRQGDIPGAGPLILRNVFRIVDSLPLAYLVGLGATLFTAQHVRIGDLAAGTLLVFDPGVSLASFAHLSMTVGGRVDPHTADVVQELLDRWKDLEPSVSSSLARSLLVRIDPQVSPQQLDSMNSHQVRARLAALLMPQAPSPGAPAATQA
jgi:uncharacterized RDD family membrane protein YckC